MTRFPCPRCRHKTGYALKSGYKRCSKCGLDYEPGKLPLHLSKSQWRDVLEWFMRQQSSAAIARDTGLERRRVMRALTYTRHMMATDVPETFSGTVEVDETYIGGQWKNKRKWTRDKGTKRGKGTAKQPVFGIYARKGTVWAELVDDTSSHTPLPLIRKQVSEGSTVCSDTWRGYTGIATEGYVHRLVKHGEGEFSNGKGTHINGLEGFWGYIKRRLAAKGGIRRERLGLYLAEYVWRYNNRKLPVDEQVKKLLALLRNRRKLV